MRAAYYESYGPPEVVKLIDVPNPALNDNSILIQVKASTVSAADFRLRSYTMPRGFGLLGRLAFGLFRPRMRILGSECSGVIAAIGKKVTSFKIGDDVTAFRGAKFGCHAEYVAVGANDVVTMKPAGMSFTEAASLAFGGITALYFLRDKAALQAHEKILVIGAAGAVGSAALQLSRHFGANVSTLTSKVKIPLMQKLGADHCYDYGMVSLKDLTDTYDVIFDAVGVTDLRQCQGLLTEGGRLILAAGNLPQIMSSMRSAKKLRRKVFAGSAPEVKTDLETLTALASKGCWHPVIDRVYSFSEIVAAHRYVDTGRKSGTVVISFDPKAVPVSV